MEARSRQRKAGVKIVGAHTDHQAAIRLIVDARSYFRFPAPSELGCILSGDGKREVKNWRIVEGSGHDAAGPAQSACIAESGN